MNTDKYISLLANPQRISPEDLFGIGTVLSKFPYFQNARALQLKGLKNQNSFLYNDALKTTAAYTTDRDVLFEYITSENFIQNEISQAILQYDESVKEIPVISENISELVSIEIDNQLKEELKKAEAILNPALFERKIAAIEKIASKEKHSEIEKLPAKTESPSEVLEIDKPLPFTKEDTHSFSEWLQLTRIAPIDRNLNSAEVKPSEKIAENKEKDIIRKFEMIEKFIQERPKIIPSEKNSFTTQTTQPQQNLAAPFTESSDSLMTETLAKVYLQQKNYKKAIQAYKILILKNPEKSGFFADQIRAVEKLINTK